MTKGPARTSWATHGHLSSGTGLRLWASLPDLASFYCWHHRFSCWQPHVCCAAGAVAVIAASTLSQQPSELGGCARLLLDSEPDWKQGEDSYLHEQWRSAHQRAMIHSWHLHWPPNMLSIADCVLSFTSTCDCHELSVSRLIITMASMWLWSRSLLFWSCGSNTSLWKLSLNACLTCERSREPYGMDSKLTESSMMTVPSRGKCFLWTMRHPVQSEEELVLSRCWHIGVTAFGSYRNAIARILKLWIKNVECWLYRAKSTNLLNSCRNRLQKCRQALKCSE